MVPLNKTRHPIQRCGKESHYILKQGFFSNVTEIVAVLEFSSFQGCKSCHCKSLPHFASHSATGRLLGCTHNLTPVNNMSLQIFLYYSVLFVLWRDKAKIKIVLLCNNSLLRILRDGHTPSHSCTLLYILTSST